MDEAGSRARIGAMTRPPELKEIEAEIEEIKARKEKAIKEQDFEGAAAMRDREKQAKEKQDSVLSAWKASREEKRVVWMKMTFCKWFPNGPASRSNAWNRARPSGS